MKRLARYGLLCSLLLALLSCVAARGGEEEGEGEESLTRTVVLTKDKRVGDRRMQKRLDELPEGHKLQIEYEKVYDMSKRCVVELIKSITPVNKDDKPDGEQQHFGAWKGMLRSVSYKDGVLDGVERTYLNGGKHVRSETPWKEGKIEGVKKIFHPNGKVMTQVNYKDGKPVGESKSYDDEGRVTRVGKFKDGRRHGDMIDYWSETGKVKRIVPYDVGKVNGTVKQYYKNGKLKAELPFKQDSLHGIEKRYDAEGKLTKQRYWIDGELVSQAEFDEDFEK